MEAIIVDSKETRKNSNSNNNNNFDKLVLLSRSDGYTIGSRFLDELSRAVTENGAFDSFLNKNPALIEFSKDHKFFKSLLTSIGKEIRHRATWTNAKLEGHEVVPLVTLASERSERAVRTPVGATTSHFQILRFAIVLATRRVATHCLFRSEALCYRSYS